jgi:hypothetical protein
MVVGLCEVSNLQLFGICPAEVNKVDDADDSEAVR